MQMQSASAHFFLPINFLTLNFKMSDFEKSITSAKQRIFTILANQREEEYESNLEAATCIAARSQAASEAAKKQEPFNRKERSQFSQQIKPREESALKVWAKEKDLWIDDVYIKKIAQRYIAEGAEQSLFERKRHLCS